MSPAGGADVVVAVGVTTPTDRLPLDIRLWKLGAVATPGRIVAVPIPGPDPGSWLWLPDPAATAVAGAWPSGRYRLDVLLGSGITRLLTTIPGDIGSVAAAPAPSGPPADIPGSIGGLPAGPIAVIGSEVIAVDAEVSNR